MREQVMRGRVLAALAGGVAACGAVALAAAGIAASGAVPAARAAVPAAGVWGRAIEVPGLAALNTGGHARVNSVSCASAGNCAAGGYYRHRGRQQGFVVVERHGVWRRAIEVPGLGALNRGGQAVVSSVSCASAGNCVAGGYYAVSSFLSQGFVVVEQHGVWRRAIEVPGLAALSKFGAFVTSVSCGAAGSCAAGGYYQNRDASEQGFVAVERSGRWRRATQVPGLASLNVHRIATVTSVSCGAAGNCAAGGDYLDSHYNFQGFVASEVNGVWSAAIEVPGLEALNTDGDAVVNSVSCGSAGSCVAGGYYTYNNPYAQGFVASEVNGVWGTAIEVPGLAALDNGRDAVVSSVSCPSAGSCAVGGRYNTQDFVASEVNGVWGTAIEVPGLAALNKFGSTLLSVSCGSADNCAVGGRYLDRHGFQGFVASEVNGVWGTAIEVPGLAALNTGGNAKVYSVSCPPTGSCVAGGVYATRDGSSQGFVAVERAGR